MDNDMQREAFEKWASSWNYNIGKFHSNDYGYASPSANIAWDAWQAAILHMIKKENGE